MERIITLLGAIFSMGLLIFGIWIVLYFYHSPAYQKRFSRRFNNRVSKYLKEGASILEAHNKANHRELTLHVVKVLFSIILTLCGIAIGIFIVYDEFVY